MRRGVGVPIAAILIAATACTDSSGAADPSPATTVTTITTTPPTTDSTTTTSAPTTTSTTDAPTTTVDPTDQLIADIEADLNAGEQVVIQGGARPGAPESRANLERYFTGQALDVVLDFYSGLEADGLVVRPNPVDASFIVVTDLVQTGDGEATVEYCRVDTSAVVEVLGDGSERVVNDAIVQSDNRVTVVRLNGTWKNAGGGELLNEQQGVTECG